MMLRGFADGGEAVPRGRAGPLAVHLAFRRPFGAGERSTFSRAEFKYPWERGAILDFGAGRGGKMTPGFRSLLASPCRAVGTRERDRFVAKIRGCLPGGIGLKDIVPLGHISARKSAQRLQKSLKRRVPSLSSFPSI